MKHLWLLLAAVAALALPAAAAPWPDKVFAPYMYVGTGDQFKLTDCADACGQKYYTLAFLIAGPANQPAWDGRIPLSAGFYTNQIAAIRARGGDVIISFGGEGGREIALVQTNAAVLQAQYQAVIDAYHVTWLDFDIEGRALENAAANRRRNTALAGLQARNPGLRLSFTLPVDPNGLPAAARTLLADARARGVTVYSANVMTMDFGPDWSRGHPLWEVAAASALKAHEQCVRIDPGLRLGLTPDLGQNDVKTEIFTLADARALMAWAKARPWVASVSFWNSNRDAARTNDPHGDTSTGIPQPPWAFTRIFQTFTQP